MSEHQKYGPSWTRSITPEEISNFYNKNVKPLFEGKVECHHQVANSCEDCCDGKDPERCVQQEHLHGLKALLTAPLRGRPEKECPECGGIDCPGAPRFKGLCGMTEKAEPAKLACPVMTGYVDIDNFLWETLEVMRKKGHDYRQGNDDDLLHNFRSVAEQVGSTPEKVWFTYFYKHYAALSTYIKNGGQSESEPIEGRITDMIVYLLLFHQMVQEHKTKTFHGTPPMGWVDVDPNGPVPKVLTRAWPSDNDHQ